jgi:transmembrane sensor
MTNAGARIDTQLASEARDWLILLTSGRATAADARALRQWCEQSAAHAQAFEQEKALWQGLKPAAQQMQHQAQARRFGRRAFLGGAIAASAAFVMIQVSVPGGLAGLNADFTTAVGEQQRFQLADGATLELNTQTRVTRRQAPDGEQGLELLGGEVEIANRQQRALMLQVGNGWISAAHARFNVRNTDQRVCVTCLEGVLRVAVQGRDIELQSGRQLIYDAGQVTEPQTVDTSAVVAERRTGQAQGAGALQPGPAGWGGVIDSRCLRRQMHRAARRCGAAELIQRRGLALARSLQGHQGQSSGPST